ncbi:MAG: hypothetical protein RIC57_08265 [Balneola sp.]|jgi:hypothetical protein|tara:strand:- start:55488 stop:55865 length:378 start_codon:yes stop_codon:yes gene_type:complete
MKDYKLETEQREDYLFAYYEAERDSIDLSNAIWEEISLKMKEYDLTKILVVENIKMNPSTVFEMYQIIQASFKLGFAGKSIAFVDLVEEHYKHNKFGETLGRNLGVNCKIFKTKTAAHEWLKTQP